MSFLWTGNGSSAIIPLFVLKIKTKIETAWKPVFLAVLLREPICHYIKRQPQRWWWQKLGSYCFKFFFWPPLNSTYFSGGTSMQLRPAAFILPAWAVFGSLRRENSFFLTFNHILSNVLFFIYVDNWMLHIFV